jgi:hypothetical protein
LLKNLIVTLLEVHFRCAAENAVANGDMAKTANRVQEWTGVPKPGVPSGAALMGWKRAARLGVVDATA